MAGLIGSRVVVILACLCLIVSCLTPYYCTWLSLSYHANTTVVTDKQLLSRHPAPRELGEDGRAATVLYSV